MEKPLTSNAKLYAKRDIVEQGQAYCDHVQAMTAEELHAKSDIAAELAHRDIEIERMRQWEDEAGKTLNRLAAFLQAKNVTWALSWRDWIDNALKELDAYSPREPRAQQPAITPRRPLDDDRPDGLLESDQDFVLNNLNAAVEFLEGTSQPPGPSPLALYAYAMTERYLNGYRLILGFDTLTKVQAAHKQACDLAVLARDALTSAINAAAQDLPNGSVKVAQPPETQLVKGICSICHKEFEGHPGDNTCHPCWLGYEGMTAEELIGTFEPPLEKHPDTARLDFLDSQRKWGDCFMVQDIDSGDVYVRPWRYKNQQGQWQARIVASNIRAAIDLARAIPRIDIVIVP